MIRKLQGSKLTFSKISARKRLLKILGGLFQGKYPFKMGNYTILQMFENSRRGTQARNFTTNVPKILVVKSSSEQIFSRNLPLGAPELSLPLHVSILLESAKSSRPHVFESFLPVIEYPFLSSIHFCRIDSVLSHNKIHVFSLCDQCLVNKAVSEQPIRFYVRIIQLKSWSVLLVVLCRVV